MKWTKGEENFLKRKYGEMSPKELADLLGRTKSSITHKASQLGVTKEKKYWTEEEIEVLKKNYHKKTAEEIADLLGRTENSVTHKARRLGVAKEKKHWTEEETEILKKNYHKKTAKEISEMIDRTPGAIRNKASCLGLKKGNLKYSLPDSAREPSSELAWLIGYILGDGSLIRERWRIGVVTKDEELKKKYLDTFKKWYGENINFTFIESETILTPLWHIEYL